MDNDNSISSEESSSLQGNDKDESSILSDHGDGVSPTTHNNNYMAGCSDCVATNFMFCQLECTFPDIDILNGILSNDLHNVILQEEEEEAAAREKEGALILLW